MEIPSRGPLKEQINSIKFVYPFGRLSERRAGGQPTEGITTTKSQLPPGSVKSKATMHSFKTKRS